MHRGSKPAVVRRNGIELDTGDVPYLLDPARTVEGAVNVISHAHSDHLPRGGRETRVVSTDKTIELASHRTGRRFTGISAPGVSLLGAGHIPGSAMALIEDGKRVLYTGDFCTRRKLYLEPAKPVRTDILIIEATYGRPEYVFPDAVELSGVIRDWVSDAVSSSIPVFFVVYPLGKAQEIETVLRGLPLFADEDVQAHNRLVFGGCDDWIGSIQEAKDAGSVFICSSRRSLAAVPGAIRRRLLFATVSGWAVAPGFKNAGGFDEAFPLSDHCDYNDLIDFVRKCNPSHVYTVHGFTESLAASIADELGIEAEPLKRHASGRKRGQRRIDTYP